MSKRPSIKKNVRYTQEDTKLKDEVFADISRMDAGDRSYKYMDELFERYKYHREKDLWAMDTKDFWDMVVQYCIDGEDTMEVCDKDGNVKYHTRVDTVAKARKYGGTRADWILFFLDELSFADPDVESYVVDVYIGD